MNSGNQHIWPISTAFCSPADRHNSKLCFAGMIIAVNPIHPQHYMWCVTPCHTTREHDVTSCVKCPCCVQRNKSVHYLGVFFQICTDYTQYTYIHCPYIWEHALVINKKHHRPYTVTHIDPTIWHLALPWHWLTSRIDICGHIKWHEVAHDTNTGCTLDTP